MSDDRFRQQAIDLGGDVQNAEIRFLDGEAHGLYYEHPCAGGKLAPGWVPFTGEYRWEVQQSDPLTITPSLLCRVCGHHGFVRNGKWVPA